jgi:hypothetical protein
MAVLTKQTKPTTLVAGEEQGGGGVEYRFLGIFSSRIKAYFGGVMKLGKFKTVGMGGAWQETCL